MTSCPEQSRAVQKDSRLVQSSLPLLGGWTLDKRTTPTRQSDLCATGPNCDERTRSTP
jgi:hypothetical protein